MKSSSFIPPPFFFSVCGCGCEANLMCLFFCGFYFALFVSSLFLFFFFFLRVCVHMLVNCVVR